MSSSCATCMPARIARDCWARLYCAGGCAANALHATGDIHGTYEYGCKVFRKRMECALMMEVAQRLDPELAKNAVKFESDCDGCGEGNDGACDNDFLKESRQRTLTFLRKTCNSKWNGHEIRF